MPTPPCLCVPSSFSSTVFSRQSARPVRRHEGGEAGGGRGPRRCVQPELAHPRLGHRAARRQGGLGEVRGAVSHRVHGGPAVHRRRRRARHRRPHGGAGGTPHRRRLERPRQPPPHAGCAQHHDGGQQERAAADRPRASGSGGIERCGGADLPYEGVGDGERRGRRAAAHRGREDRAAQPAGTDDPRLSRR